MSYLPTRRIFFLSAATALLALLVLVGCSFDTAPAQPTPTLAPPTPTPLPRGGNLTIRMAADVPSLRPWQPRSRAEEQISSLMYSGLMRLDAQLRPQPDLAATWDTTADGRMITFTLRPDVYWHDGQRLTSADVVWTLNALKALPTTAPTGTALLTDLHRIAAVTAPTSQTVEISLTERYAPIFSELSVPILPEHVLKDKNLATLDFWDVPVGSGPFQFGGREPGTTITLNANKAFYRGPPLLDRAVFLAAPDPAVSVKALGDGQLLLAELPWNSVSTLRSAAPTMQTGFYPENGYYFLAFNVRSGRPFADGRVRTALAQAIDLGQVVRDSTGEQGLPIANSAAPGSWADFVRPITVTADVARARTLLDGAGWKEQDGVRSNAGVTLTAQLFVRGDDPRRVRAAEIIARAAQSVGISVTVQRADFDTVIRSKYAPPYDFDLLLGSWSNGAGDASFSDYTYYDPNDFALFHSSQINQGVADNRPVQNIVGFRDSAYDNQASAAVQLYDLDQRGKAIQLAQERINEEKPYVFLWADRIPVVLSPQLTTLDGPINLDTPMYLGNVERWYLKK